MLHAQNRERLACVNRWARTHGWTPDVYPPSWRNADGTARVRIDGYDALVVEWFPFRRRGRSATVSGVTVAEAIEILMALGVLPRDLPSFYLTAGAVA
jgi:hypothetical protein